MSNIDNIPAPKDQSDERRQPTREQSKLRRAVDKLTRRQRIVWDLYNYDRKTQDEIARLLHISQSAVSQRLQTIEKRLVALCGE